MIAEGGRGSSAQQAHPGVAQTGAVQVPEGHEANVPDDMRAEIEEIMARYPHKRSASIPVLFLIQHRYGWCSPEGIQQGAAVMGVTPAYLESVASFYDLFHLEPAGQHRVLVCTNISCWMRGGDELLQSFCEAAGADAEHAGHGGTVNAEGDLFVSGFECLGACDLAPMASIDEHYYGPLEAGDAEAVVEALRSGSEVLPEKRIFPGSLHQLVSLGIYPQRQKILVAKGTQAPRAAYEPVSARIIEVDSGGTTAVNPARFTYKRVRRPLFGLE